MECQCQRSCTLSVWPLQVLFNGVDAHTQMSGASADGSTDTATASSGTAAGATPSSTSGCDAWRHHLVKYVDQEDRHMPLLTVRETLQYAEQLQGAQPSVRQLSYLFGAMNSLACSLWRNRRRLAVPVSRVRTGWTGGVLTRSPQLLQQSRRGIEGATTGGRCEHHCRQRPHQRDFRWRATTANRWRDAGMP